MTRQHLVISAVNLVEGGTLAVLRECLQAARDSLSDRWDVTAIVHSADIVGVSGIRYVERPEIKRSWAARVWFEYVECKRLSRELKPDLWLAMHDMTPRVEAARQAVYCHNAMCFYRISWREALFDPKQLVFVLLYAHLYRINLHANWGVIVQQDWIREEFYRRYGCSNVIVAHPVADSAPTPLTRRSGTHFFYPSFPRVFKNFETLLHAWEILCRDPAWRGQLVVTVDGKENAYARSLVARYGRLRDVRFVGRMSHAAVQEEYQRADCVVFPSRLESWGMPLTEAKQHGLPILAADLPYAHETIGTYPGASFFAARDPRELADKMLQFALGTLELRAVTAKPIEQPHAHDWVRLFHLLIEGPRSKSAARST